jgi:SAM-dependent methyltransferase
LSVVMPCFNEERTVGQVVRAVLASPWVAEVIAVDDCSTDGTRALLEGVADPRLRVLAQPSNQGKGAALRRGFVAARSPYVIVQDADLEYDPGEYGLLLRPVLEDKADVVYGSRFHAGRPHRVLYFWHSVGNRVLTTFSNAMTNLNLSDVATCYKLFRREVLESLVIEEDRFGFEAEITAKVSRAGWRIYEVGISYAGRTYSEGKKASWSAGVRSLYCVLRYARGGGPATPGRGRPEISVTFEEADTELADTLANLEGAANYADWIMALAEPHLGEHVLEVGAGHGSMTERLAARGRVTATELSERCVPLLEERYRHYDHVTVFHGDVLANTALGPFDSVVLVNVLEHIENDEKALRSLMRLLRPGGTVVLYVPALEGLYSDFDRRIGHHRRYRRAQLASVMLRAGLEPVDLRYVNTVGALAWWLMARKLRRSPTAGWAVELYDKAVVPVLRRLESGRRPPVGQSIFAVGRRPEHDAIA